MSDTRETTTCPHCETLLVPLDGQLFCQHCDKPRGPDCEDEGCEDCFPQDED